MDSMVLEADSITALVCNKRYPDNFKINKRSANLHASYNLSNFLSSSDNRETLRFQIRKLDVHIYWNDGIALSLHIARTDRLLRWKSYQRRIGSCIGVYYRVHCNRQFHIFGIKNTQILSKSLLAILQENGFERNRGGPSDTSQDN